MILAAGRGERMGALTASRPKPLLEIHGESLIERHLRRLSRAGIHEIVVNLSYFGSQIRERLRDGARWDVSIAYSDEGEPPLETAGGIVRALPLIGADPFLLINADIVTDFDFTALRTLRGRGCLVLVPNPPHHPAGDFGLDENSKLSLGEPLSTFAGISLFDPALFAGLSDGPRKLKPILDAAITESRLYGVRHEGLWIDVGTPERLDEASAALGGRGPAD